MKSHLQSSRTVLIRSIVVLGLIPIALLSTPPAPGSRLAPITGRVTYAGKPVADMVICFDLGIDHAAFCTLGPDGSFELTNFRTGGGAIPGRYRVHLYSWGPPSIIPSRYHDPMTSGLEVAIDSGWHHIDLDLY